MKGVIAKEWRQMTTDSIMVSIEIAIQVLRSRMIEEKVNRKRLRQIAIDLLQMSS